MKIFFWTDGFWPRLGGIETQGFHFINNLQKKGHQCMVMAQKDEPDWKADEVHEGIAIKRFDFNTLITYKNLEIMHDIHQYLEWIITTFQPDIIHLNTVAGGSAFAFLLCREKFQVPIVLTAHAPYLRDNKLSPFITKIALSVDKICCVSRWVLQELAMHLPQIKPKLKLIYNGLPMPNTIPKPLSFSEPILLLAGRLSWEKGFDTAIHAFSLLKKSGSNAQLMIVGMGPERLNLEKLVNSLALTHAVTFTGALSNAELQVIFNQATMVIAPSILESFGLVILESMQLQRPVIASHVQGVPELVCDGETGILVPEKNAVAIYQAIRELLNQPERAINMGLAGRKRAAQFTLDQNISQYEMLYETLQVPT